MIAAVLCTLLLRLQLSPSISPDGQFYKTRPDLRPYCMRSFWPFIVSRLPGNAWEALSLACLCASGYFVGVWAGNAWATVLYMGLPLVRTCVRFPVLTDQPALLVFTMGLATGNPWLMALGGLFNEKVPLFGASALWDPLALTGLLIPALLYAMGKKPKPSDPEWLRHPFREAWKLKKRLVDPSLTVLPWGSFVFGVNDLTMKGGALLLAGYGQLLFAQDGARLYQWAFPALLPGVVSGFGAVLPVLALWQWANPWRDTV